MVGLFMIILTVLLECGDVVGKFTPNPAITDCVGIQCQNGGQINEETCTCQCTSRYMKPFCETERQPSQWPKGVYAIPASMYGCPETSASGWTTGYINMTLSSPSNSKQKWPRSFRLLGPYSTKNNFQLTVCTMVNEEEDFSQNQTSTSLKDNMDATTLWPDGNYCLFRVKGFLCPVGFKDRHLPLKDYKLQANRGGMIPKYNETGGATADSLGVTIHLCCKTNHQDVTIDLPNNMQLYLIKPSPDDECSQIKGMKLTIEIFSFIKLTSQNWTSGIDDLLVNEDEHFYDVQFCHYIPTEARECLHREDKGTSYRGNKNTTADGWPCLPWTESSYTTNKDFKGDFDKNYCRLYRKDYTKPKCHAKKKNNYVECSIDYCDDSNDPPNVARNRPVNSSPIREGFDAIYAVDGNFGKPPSMTKRPVSEQFIQIDLQSTHLVHAVTIHKTYTYKPYNIRDIVVFASLRKWDFTNGGANICDGPWKPYEVKAFRFQCQQPVLSRYITIVNFKDFNGTSGVGRYYMLELSEVVVRGTDTGCGRPLGMASGVIQDFQITASSIHPETDYAYFGRLNSPKGWCAHSKDNIPYIQIDLLTPMVINGIIIQGLTDGRTDILPTSFTVYYGLNGSNFTLYQDNDWATFTLDETLIPDEPQTFLFSSSIVARYIRVVITEYDTKPCLKLELLGCPKRVEFDLSCGSNSTFLGWQTLVGHDFYMEREGSGSRVESQTLSSCQQACAQWQLPCNSATFSTKTKSCSLLMGNRYSRHNNHWWVSGVSTVKIYMQRMCLKDIKPMLKCGGKVTSPGEVYSPSYPFYYGEYINCTWIVTSPPGQFVQIDLIDVKLAAPEINAEIGNYRPNMGRCEDELVIYDRSLTQPEIYRATGNQNMINPRTRVISSSRTLEINLRSCYRLTETKARGFNVRVSYSDCPGCGFGEASCSSGVVCTSQCGYIASLNFPDDYPVSSTCSWRISGTIGQYVEASFKHLDVKGDWQCNGDYVSLYGEDLDEEKTLLGKFCKNKRPVSKISTNWHKMAIEFHSDFDNTGNGFLLKYELKTISLQNNTGSNVSDCRLGWYSYGKSCYKFASSFEPTTWVKARYQCEEEGGYLVSINDPQEMEYLHSTILIQKPFAGHSAYIGLRKLENDMFEWIDGSPLSYSAWYEDEREETRQPDGFDQELCTMLSISSIRSLESWHDVPCSYNQLHQYICEAPKLTNKSKTSFAVNTADGLQTKSFFYCPSNGEAISMVYLCDGIRDCDDGSDERECVVECPNTMFKCNNGHCINMVFYCDYKEQCKDGSDELWCVRSQCNGTYYWSCDSGQCIAKHQRCDLLTDCLDGSDESNCDFCPDATFQCYDGSCLSLEQVCDGYVDCQGQYGEDEPDTCTSKAQETCGAWQALGINQNGKFQLNINNEQFEVECLFEEDKVKTILHHNMEDKMYVGYDDVDWSLTYSATIPTISVLKETVKRCRQYVQLQCHQVYDLYQHVNWFNINGYSRTFKSTTTCSCSLGQNCDSNKQCQCSRPRALWFPLPDNTVFTDKGYIEYMPNLPITRIKIPGVKRFEYIAHQIGPLVCEEDRQVDADFVLCKSGVVTSSQSRCILEYSRYNIIKGCRDLSHLTDCGPFECPKDYVKCPGSYCIPVNQVCDGRPDCPGQQDENNCDLWDCPGYFRCRASRVCLSWNMVCDGTRDCVEGDDELVCNSTCPEDCQCNGLNTVCRDMVTKQTLSIINLKTRHLDLKRSIVSVKADDLHFQNFKDLAFLDLSYTDLKMITHDTFSYLYNLIHLDLRWNDLQTLNSNIFKHLQNLKVLNLVGNQKLYHIDTFAFLGLDKLKSLDLSGMLLSTLKYQTFQGLSSVQYLNLSMNKLTSIQDWSFSSLNNCKVLDTRDNNIHEFTGKIFNGLNNLTHLYSDRYTFCCLRPQTVPEAQCLPEPDEFSSCTDLMKNQTLRISMWILSLVALLGNLLVMLYRVMIDPNGFRRSNGIMVANLGLADFIMGVYMLIIASADQYYRGIYSWNDLNWRNSYGCQAAGFLATFSSEASVMFLCMITMDRVSVIKFPFSRHRLTKTSAIAVSIFVWILSFVFAAIPFLPIEYFGGKFYSRTGVCLGLPLTRNRSAGWEYGIAIFILWNFVCFAIIAVGQGAIYHEVKKSSQKVKRQQKQDMSVARKLSFIVMSDFVCWFPICVMGLMVLNGYVLAGDVYAWVAVFILPINSALNPIIYTMSSIDLSKISKRFKRGLTTNRKSIETSEVSESRQVTRKIRTLELFQARPPQGSVLLDDFIRRTLNVQTILDIAIRLTRAMKSLHSHNFVFGELNERNLYIFLEDEKLVGLSTNVIPVQATDYDELQFDIKLLGTFVTKMLKAYGVNKNVLNKIQ